MSRSPRCPSMFGLGAGASVSRSETDSEDGFAQWCDENELFPGTVARLQEWGFISLKAVKQLTPDIIEREFSEFPLAQRLLLTSAVAILNRPREDARETEATGSNSRPLGGGNVNKHGGLHQHNLGHGASPTEFQRDFLQHKLDSGTGLTVQDLMNFWHQPQATQHSTGVPIDASATDTVTGKSLVFDPFSQPLDADRTSPHRDICDYVSLATWDRRREQSGNLLMGDFELSLANGKVSLSNQKIELSRVTQAQYMEAGLKILREMVYKDRIGIPQIMDYVGYLTKIATLAQTFQWGSVLLYDREYRKEQADKGFAWGADNSYLMQLILRAGAPYGTHQNAGLQSGTRPPIKSKFDPNTGKAICEKWNGRFGCSLKNCRYTHVCRSCFSPSHTDAVHSQQGGAQNVNAYGQTAGQRHDRPPQTYYQPDGSKNGWA